MKMQRDGATIPPPTLYDISGSAIGHLKAEHRMERNYLKGPEDDRIDAVLAAAGHNFRLLLRWLAMILRALIVALARTIPTAPAI